MWTFLYELYDLLLGFLTLSGVFVFLLYCALSLAQCIVIGPVCGFMCLWVCGCICVCVCVFVGLLPR